MDKSLFCQPICRCRFCLGHSESCASSSCKELHCVSMANFNRSMCASLHAFISRALTQSYIFTFRRFFHHHFTADPLLMGKIMRYPTEFERLLASASSYCMSYRIFIYKGSGSSVTAHGFNIFVQFVGITRASERTVISIQ